MTSLPERAPDGADVPAPLQLTGERTLPDIPDERYWFERHVVAYELAAARVRADVASDAGRGSVVLDAGCGEGYGLAMLADAGASRVVGVDLEAPVVDHVRHRYATSHPAVEAHVAELMDLPLADGEVDLTVSFQVIEHLHDIPGYLRSLRRVTRPGGEVWIATPNRLTFTPDSDVPVNPFHTREFTADELRTECEAAGLDVVSVVGVFHGRRLRAVEVATRRTFVDLITSTSPEGWPAWLRAVVHRVDASWFRWSREDLDRSLDLLAICRVPR
ncbi:class I SAM-dependent methyltransferase [Nitriliruptoraceae bacterium ZYF776]|nr:class I SAM-dependent methyltransferase [Profundirhabdus halotolerans]